MLLFLFTCSLSFILLFKSLPLKPLLPWASEMRLLSLWFWKDLSFLTNSITNTLSGETPPFSTSRMSPKKKNFVEMSSEMSVLDLPDLVLETILEKLQPEGLCSMASVCTSMRDRCSSDHLWERHMKNKWGRIVGPAAYREWQCHVASRKGSTFFNQGKQKGLMGYLIHLWPIALVRSGFRNISKKKSTSPPVDSVMSWYLALESGNFWFPAQVYNREVFNCLVFLLFPFRNCSFLEWFL